MEGLQLDIVEEKINDVSVEQRCTYLGVRRCEENI